MNENNRKLPFIAWVTIPKELSEHISEAKDLCLGCAIENANELKEKYPKFKKQIFVSGGDCIRESDYLAVCQSCYCLLASSPYECDGECVETENQWYFWREKIDG